MYFDSLKGDILIKQSVEDALDGVLLSSHEMSQFLFNDNSTDFQHDINMTENIQNVKDLESNGQFIYQQIVFQESLGFITIEDLMLEVKYFTSPTTVVIKDQTVTDASYQLVLYML
jgi:hypothetical protein